MAAMMSPRKQMASGLKDSGAGSVGAFPAGRTHPDPSVGARPELNDSARGVGGSVAHSAGQLPAQAAPDHGPHNERQMGFTRGSKA